MDIRNIVIRKDGNYPKIEDTKPCMKTVAVLKNLMCGTNSKMQNVLRYFYQSSMSCKMEPEIANLFEEMSIVEMQHLGMISRAIVEFGGEPRYENSYGQFFSCSQINYSTKLGAMLESNIKAEEQSIKECEQAINAVDNKSLKKLLERIKEDEELHIKAMIYLRDNVRFMSY